MGGFYMAQQEIKNAEVTENSENIAEAAQAEQPQAEQPQEVQAAGEKKEEPLKTNRKLIKLILLSIITVGIYGIYFWYSVKRDVNTVCGERNGEKTMGIFKLFLLTIVTCGVAAFVWMHKLSNKIGRELNIRGIPFYFNAGTFWLWSILGLFIIVGPFIYLHRLCKSMNLLCADYNEKKAAEKL